MPRLIYTLVIIALLPWAIVHLLWRARRQPEYLHHWGERFGLFVATQSLPTIWIHAVSVGETRAAQPLVTALRVKYPNDRILFTHMTPTGRATSVDLYGDAVERIYLPYDTPWAMRHFLRHFQPRIGIIMETELWPNLVAQCRSAGVPLLLANARLSDRSAARYTQFAALTRLTLGALTYVGAQSAGDAERLRTLGATTLTVTGNLKFDIDPPADQLTLADAFRTRFGHRPVWLAASTREGEETLILDAWRKVDGGSTALLVIVPRHPQRFDTVVRLAVERGFSVQRRSDEKPVATETTVLIGDSMGEMFAWYAAADVAFIGGSLLEYGSQNLIEACAVGVPVLIGPSTYNFSEAAREAKRAGAALGVRDADELIEQVQKLLVDASQRQNMGATGRAFAQQHRGATQRTLALIETTLSENQSPLPS